MHVYMDLHRNVEGLSAEAVAEAHDKDLRVQDKHMVKYHRYWYYEESGLLLCLVEAPRQRPYIEKRMVSWLIS